MPVSLFSVGNAECSTHVGERTCYIPASIVDVIPHPPFIRGIPLHPSEERMIAMLFVFSLFAGIVVGGFLGVVTMCLIQACYFNEKEDEE